MIMTRLFTNVISFSSVRINKTSPVGQQKERNLLFRNGFGYAWIHQEVGNEVECLKSFVQRISDIYIGRIGS